MLVNKLQTDKKADTDKSPDSNTKKWAILLLVGNLMVIVGGFLAVWFFVGGMLTTDISDQNLALGIALISMLGSIVGIGIIVYSIWLKRGSILGSILLGGLSGILALILSFGFLELFVLILSR